MVGSSERAQACVDVVTQRVVCQLCKLLRGTVGFEIELQQRLLHLPALAGQRVLPGEQRVFLRLHVLRGSGITLLPPVQGLTRQASRLRHAVFVQRFAAQQPVDQPLPRAGLLRLGHDLVDAPRADVEPQRYPQTVRTGGLGLRAAQGHGSSPDTRIAVDIGTRLDFRLRLAVPCHRASAVTRPE